ncbi:MAG: MFS transporter [Planctomycetaceae bacterium TMED10]|nr:MAG: MFS transporter [Planctomycetaceae bacterium TMED10]
MLSLLSKERIVAPPGYNRWKVPPASIAIHLCIGSVYAWSIFNPALIRVRGVVTSAAGDWTLSEVVWIFTVAIATLGFAAAVAGKWLERVGPRMVGVVAALCWGGGFLIGGMGIEMHDLTLLYLGYGVLGGIGLGLGYVSPVSTLIRWFPDRRGMAAGLAIMGFGGGALIAAPMNEALIRHFYQPPTYLGTVEQVQPTTVDGKRMATVDGSEREVVVIGPSEIKNMIRPGPAGVYVVGTGRSGIARTFFALSGLYTAVMLIAAFAYRIPATDWQPVGFDAQATAKKKRKLVSTRDVSIEQAVRTPQFYLVWIVLCLNVTAGIGVLGVAKTMMSEIFGSALPDIATSQFAATFVLMISVFNMLGRFFWASASDFLGRKTTYTIFFVMGIALYLLIPVTASGVAQQPAVLWLILFYAVVMLIFTLYGGGFATIPAYLADLFGTRFVGGIHGRLLTAWSVAGVLGPWCITWLRARSIRAAIDDLIPVIDPARFQNVFGAPVAQLETLVQSKTVTLSKLLEIAPAGTIDPTSTVYNSTMLVMAGLLSVALVANLLVRAVHPKHYLSED